MSDRTPEYWGQPDDELLTCTDLNEAVEMFIDQLHGHPVPTSVTMYGYAPKLLDERDKNEIRGYALEAALEYLDDNYGSDADMESATPSQAMTDAAEAFAQVIVKEYRVSQLEQVTEPEVIDCKAWVSGHRPEWLDSIEWEKPE